MTSGICFVIILVDKKLFFKGDESEYGNDT